jgi:tRNA-specific 2-thiouridylase
MITINTPQKIIVGLSGGVDSAVSAYLLKEQGHMIEAVFMKNWEGDDSAEFCPAAQDMADAQAVCDKLGIPLHTVNFANEYWERVFAYFLVEYRAGRTPNPDILCNKEIKFRAFLDYAKQRGADFIATGHYVRTKQEDNDCYLLKGSDPLKDQSYFLHALTAAQLAQSIFPVGNLPKTEVRALAQKIGLGNATKKDSTGICFIGERKFKTFLNEYLPAQPGNIEALDGEMIGKHDGLMFYTIGQRQGLQIGGQKNKAELPWFVAKKDLTRNVLIVVQGEHSGLLQDSLIIKSPHWINGESNFPLHISAKIRYRQSDQVCTVSKIDNDHCRVDFDTPQRAVAPGQFAVFYDDDICLGGGAIV